MSKMAQFAYIYGVARVDAAPALVAIFRQGILLFYIMTAMEFVGITAEAPRARERAKEGRLLIGS